MSDTPDPAHEVGLEELAEALEAGKPVYDVREQEEFVRGHVPGVRLLPMSEIEQRWEEIPTDQGPVYFVCAVGARSGKVAEALRQQGVDAVNIAGGTKAWMDAGRRLVTGPS
jgi:rhodanese-related sulfurtransferase